MGHTDEELRQLAVDIVEGRVFGSWNIPEDEVLRMISSVFMVLAFMTDKSQVPENSVHVYEYLDKAEQRSINGFPMFFSCRFLTSDELNKLRPTVNKLREQKAAFLSAAVE